MATIDLGKIKLVWRGTYSGSTAYTVDDVVQYTDSGLVSSYICTTNSTGNAPSSSGTAHGSWAYLAKGGSTYTSTLTTQGDILYRDGSGEARLAKGTASQQLRMNSGATAPEWATVSGGDYVKLATVTVSSASTIAIDGNGSWIDNAVYGSYFFVLQHISTSNDSSSSVVRFRINASGSANANSQYYSIAHGTDANSGANADSSSRAWQATEFGLSYNNMDSETERTGFGTIELLNTGGNDIGGSGSYYPHINTSFFSHHSNSSTLYQYYQMGFYQGTDLISGITLYPAGGNIDDGIITVYGRKR